MPEDETTPQTPGGTPTTAVQDAGNVTREPDPQEVTETEGEEIAEADPQADAKLRRREQRLRRERDSAREELRTLRDQLAEKEKQMADEAQAQATEQLTTVTRERDDARAEVTALRLEKQLTGKVLDTDAALKLMGDGFRKEDGSVDVDGFLEKYPYLRPGTASNAPDGGGGTQTGGGRDGEIAEVQKQLDAAQKAGNRALAVSLQSRLTQLRQS